MLRRTEEAKDENLKSEILVMMKKKKMRKEKKKKAGTRTFWKSETKGYNKPLAKSCANQPMKNEQYVITRKWRMWMQYKFFMLVANTEDLEINQS